MDTHRETLIVFEVRKLGDAILSLPFIRGACKRYDVYVVCHPASLPVFEGVLPPDRILEWLPPWVEWRGVFGSVLACFRLIRRLRALRPMVAVCGWADARVEWFMRCSGACRRIGFPMTPLNYYSWRVPWRTRHLRHGQFLSAIGRLITGRRLLNEKLTRTDEHQPHLRDWGQVADSLGVEADMSYPWLTGGKLADEGLVAWLKQARREHRPVWAVHVGAGSAVKKWRAEGFRNLVETFFCKNNIPVVVITPPGELQLDAQGGHVFHFVPMNFPELIALAGRVDAVLCNDSVMSHLAAAMGKRVVAVFGPSDPGAFAPYGNEQNLVISSVCVYRPCMDRCLMPSPICMETIQDSDVLEKVRAVHTAIMAEVHNG